MRGNMGQIPPRHHPFPEEYYAFLDLSLNSVLLETSRVDDENFRSLLFLNPIAMLVIHEPREMDALLEQIEEYLHAGFHVAGYFTYESGYAFEHIAQLKPSPSPLARLGVYRAPLVFDHRDGAIDNHAAPPSSNKNPSFSLTRPQLATTEDEYRYKIARIREYIRQGHTYQINFTTKFLAGFEGSPLAFYQSLKQKQRVAFGGILTFGDETIVCLSPELFFRKSGDTIITRPMKGTIRRGKTLLEDRLVMEALASDPKNRAENVMIVDLLRNDLGRIATMGSVNVTNLFSVERYETLCQMTSDVSARIHPGTSWKELFRAIFPSGSVTGAPKIRSMQIIHELEAARRGVYTGAIGYFSPDGDAVFNVAIRTAVIRDGKCEMGVGSGIVWDSDPDAEFAECKLKGEFLTTEPFSFDLTESLLWDNGFPLLPLHIARLSDSAAYFDFPFDAILIQRELQNAVQHLPDGIRHKVRLTLSATGGIHVTCEILQSVDGTRFVALAPVRVNSADRFLYHKTTHRGLFEEYRHKATEQGLEDYLFLNERNEISEGTWNTLVIRKGSTFYTPPMECGVLPGVYRAHLLATRRDLESAVITAGDLSLADGLFLCNAVRGLREVTFRP